MARVSFMQTSMLGGRWSAQAQGRMHDPAYKTALSECLNAYPQEEGAWTRRPGFRYLAHTRHGADAIIKALDFTPDEPYVLEFTALKLRIFTGNSHLLDSTANVLNISTATPAVVTIDVVPSGWANGDSVIFTLENDPCGAQSILCNRQFTIGGLSGTTFTLLDPISGASIDGSTIGFVLGAAADSVGKIFELTTPYTVDELDAIRVVSDDSTVLILHPDHQPRLLSKNSSGVFTIATQEFQDGPYLDTNDPKTNNITLTLSAITGTVTGTFSGITGINNDTGLQTTDVGRLVRFQGGPPIWDKSTAYHKTDQVTGSDGNIYTAQGGMSGLDPTLDDGTHWTISPAHVNWIWLKIATRTSTTVFTATVESDLRDDGTFATIEGNGNIRAAIGDSGFPQLDAKLNQIDFAAFFAPGQSVIVSNGTFTDGAGGDISSTYTVKGVWSDPDDNRSLLSFTTDGGQTSDWATINGLTESRTAYFSPSVGQTLAGDELTTPVWRLGLYSDTDGWPSNGTYHETRLALVGSASNRVDFSKSNSEGATDPDIHFDFAPTAVDGTVADDNAIAAIAAATEQNTFFWPLSTEYGLVLGSLAGEWLVRASTLDDPLSPSSIQMRRVTAYGSANIEPQICLRTLAFVQRHGRRVLDFANYPWGEAAGWYADNLDHLAQDLTCGGIAELRYQQTPAWNLWMRRTDGTLIGSAFRHAAYGKESFNGWHRHEHGDDRIFRSLAVGVSGVSGEGEQLYAVTNQTDSGEPDYNVRWIEVLAPEFDGCNSCDAFFCDGAPDLCCAALTGGTTPTGLRIYGLWHLNGKTIQPFLAGLDLGDYVVANGKIDISFGDSTKGYDASLLTWAYLQTLDACDLFGTTASLSITATPANPDVGGLEAFVSPETTVKYDINGGNYLADPDLSLIVGVQGTSGGDGGIQTFNRNSTGDEAGESDNVAVFGAGPAHAFAALATARLHPNGNLYCPIDSITNRQPVACVRVSDRSLLGITGTADSGFGSSASFVASLNAMAPVVQGSNNYIATCGLTSAGVTHEIALWTVTAGPMVYANKVSLADNSALVCEGLRGRGDFYVLGYPSFGGGSTTAIKLYEFWASGFPAYRTIATLAPSDIDATWVHYTSAHGPGFDQADGNLLIIVGTGDAVTNTLYLVKVNRLTGAVVWKTALTSRFACDLTKSFLAGTLGIFDYVNHNALSFDLSTGVQTTTAWDTGLSLTSQFFDCENGCTVALLSASYAHGTGPVPTYIGQWLAANANTIPSKRVVEIFSAATLAVADSGGVNTAVTDYPFYGSVGFTYTSRGQLLRPDFGQDGGAQAGPAFGKKRRIHKAAIALVNARGLTIGTSFDHLRTVFLLTDGGSTIASPTLFTGTIPFQDQEINDTPSTDSRLCWEVTRPYPCTVTALAGSLDTKDE